MVLLDLLHRHLDVILSLIKRHLIMRLKSFMLTDSYFSPYEFEDEVYDMLNHDPTLTPEDLYDMYSTNFPHFGLEDYRKICEDYRMFWCDDEEDIYEEKSTDLKTLEVWKET